MNRLPVAICQELDFFAFSFIFFFNFRFCFYFCILKFNIKNGDFRRKTTWQKIYFSFCLFVACKGQASDLRWLIEGYF